MKKSQIDQMFTAKVTEYITEGYTINTNSMGGSQGEVAKVDLVKGNTLLRVWLNKEYVSNWDDDNFKFHGNVLVLRVGKWKKDAIKEAARDSWCTVWMNDLETIYQEVFYEIGRTNSCYYGTEEEAIAAQQVSRTRYRATRFYNSKEILITNDKAREAGYNFLKRTQGYKRVSFNDIVIRKRVSDGEPNTYYVVYHGNAYKMR